jgi:hypothetical protein
MSKLLNLSALAQSIDTTWGRSSTPKTASYSVKFLILGGDRLQASYNVITNFVSEKEMILMKRSCSEESIQIIDAHIKNIKKLYKEISGDSLTVKEEDSSDSIEIIGFNVHNPKRTAYFRRKTIFSLA